MSSPSLDKIYRFMDALHTKKSRILNLVKKNSESLTDGPVRFMLCGVTTLCFESFDEGDLRQCGRGKGNKFKETQIALALRTTNDRVRLPERLQKKLGEAKKPKGESVIGNRGTVKYLTLSGGQTPNHYVLDEKKIASDSQWDGLSSPEGAWSRIEKAVQSVNPETRRASPRSFEYIRLLRAQASTSEGP